MIMNTVQREGCTHKVPLSLLLLLHFFHHLGDSLQLGIHQLLLELLVLEHFVYVLPERHRTVTTTNKLEVCYQLQ